MISRILAKHIGLIQSSIERLAVQPDVAWKTRALLAEEHSASETLA
jgi:hypothetical protein